MIPPSPPVVSPVDAAAKVAKELKHELLEDIRRSDEEDLSVEMMATASEKEKEPATAESNMRTFLLPSVTLLPTVSFNHTASTSIHVSKFYIS